jgi:oligopeptide transport system permease protein
VAVLGLARPGRGRRRPPHAAECPGADQRAVTLGIPTAIFTEAGLSFLGFGMNDPLPGWGKMVSDSPGYARVYWYVGLFPTLVLALTMLSFSFVGDGLRDALDPQLGNH